MNAFSSLGGAVADTAGAGLKELQRADTLQTLQQGQQAFTGGQNELNRAADVSLQKQKSDAALELARLTDQMTGARESAGRVQAGDIAAAAAEKEQAAQLLRTQTTVNAPPPETRNAIARSKMTPEEKTAEDELQPGRARFSYLPTTQPDPDNPGKVRSGILKLDNHGILDPEFINTGTDPNKPGAGGMGNRAEVYFNRTTKASTLAAEAAKNIMELPIESSAGIFSGRGQGTGLMAAAKESLVNAATSQAVQDYNVMVAGITRNLSTIESSGLSPPGSFTKSMDAVTLKEGDSELTKMRKMAEIRQIVEMGAEPDLANPRISIDQKTQLQGVVDKIKTAIPFTHSDITALQRAKDPKMTIGDVVSARLSGKPIPIGGGAAPDDYAGTGGEGLSTGAMPPPAGRPPLSSFMAQ
jgi:hypothetical protein